ncbi:MAG: gluconokinase, GntK/IdnK-type [Henriciella sp.]
MYLIFMGVSGSGKSTYARLASEAFDLPFFEADDFHPPENVEKMSTGIPLNDADRVDWLAALCNAVSEHASDRAVISCSALTPFVQATLEEALPQPPTYVCLDVSEAELRARMGARSAHFMPATLLASQFAALTVPESAIRIANEGTVERVFERIHEVVSVLVSASKDQGQ